MKRPWHKFSVNKPWIETVAEFGITRHDTPEYHTTRWRRLRQQQLNEHPTCQRCELMGRTTAATVVDHIRSIADGGDIWNPANLQSLCARCHRVKTNQEISRRKHGNK